MRCDLSRLLASILGATLALGLVGCLDPVDPSQAEVAAIRVMFGAADTTDTVQVRGTTRARAIALARDGFDLGRTDFTYSSSDTTVAAVDASGVVRGIRAGTAVIRASLPDGRSGAATVVVAASTIAYTIPVGSSPGAMAFSTDYTRLYVVTGPDSLAIVDALGFFRLQALRLGLPGGGVAATGDAVYVTHPLHDSVTVIATGTNAVTGRIFVGAGPTGAAATNARVFIAARFDRKVVIVESGKPNLAIPAGGEPHDVAVARNGRRLFATVESSGAWRLLVAAPEFPDTLGSVALPGRPGAIATDGTGSRVYVLLPDAGRVLVFAEGADGRYREESSIAVGSTPGGVSARLTGTPIAVVSGEPAMVLDPTSTVPPELVPGAGSGQVAIRPDGLFAFIAVPSAGVLRVISL